MIWCWILLIVGMLLLIKGADFFVDGASNIAKLLGIPSLVIGLTLVSIGTSAPEASVSIQAALNGSNDISLGNVLGSNVVNSTLILGLSALVAPILITKDVKYYDIPIMVGVSGLLALFSYVITPDSLERWEAIILFVLFALYIAFLVIRSRNDIKKEKESLKQQATQPLTKGDVANKKINSKFILEMAIFLVLVVSCILFTSILTPNKFELHESIIITAIFAIYVGLLIARVIINHKNKNKENDDDEIVPEEQINHKKLKIEFIFKSIILVIIGLGGIIIGGTVVVENAKAIASDLGMSETLVGLTIVAVGTSLPELVTSMIAAYKKENDIAIGNVVGSNIFNIVFVLGLSSIISPIKINPDTLFDGIVVCGIGIVIFLFCIFSKKLKRWQGGILAAIYIGYLAYIITRDILATGTI